MFRHRTTRTTRRPAAIAEAARRLVTLRDRWLNPPRVGGVGSDEPVPGYPRRPVAHDEEAEKALKKRTLTNLYNARPQWLDDAHAALDTAVAVAYGWDSGMSEDDALRELLALNLDPNPSAPVSPTSSLPISNNSGHTMTATENAKFLQSCAEKSLWKPATDVP